MATSSYQAGASYSESRAGVSARGAGWVAFAAVIIGFAGTFNVIDGIVALSKAKFFVGNAVYVFSDLRTWGWITLILGIVQIAVAFALFAGSQFARWFGVVAASLSALGQLLFIQAYPWWSLAIFTMDILVIYALTVYGGKDYSEAV